MDEVSHAECLDRNKIMFGRKGAIIDMKQSFPFTKWKVRIWNWTIQKTARKLSFVFVLLFLVALFDHGDESSFNRSSFPSEFVFGTASSAYQYEGMPREDGKGPSIWDSFTHLHPEKIQDRSNGDLADDFYHRYREDTKTLKNMGMDAFRISISWPRILPNGSLSGGINKQGIHFYNNLIDELLANGIQPFVTLFHWDLPQALEDMYGGFLSYHILGDYRDYTEICFKEFGDRVKHWITFNEPHLYCSRGYAGGRWPPARCSAWEARNCTAGDSGTEPYIAGHNMLIAHSSVVKLYRDKYQAIQKGKIGISLDTSWFLRYSSSIHDIDAASRSMDFGYGWFMGPLTFGEYPLSMREFLQNRLPKFTKEESVLVKGSYDFVGINYYATHFSKDNPDNNPVNMSYDTDSRANLTGQNFDGIKLPKPYNTSWIYIYPPGIRDLLVYIKNNYENPIIYITENGVNEPSNGTLPLKEALKDDIRLAYHRDHLLYLRSAIREGVDVRGYFAWSLLDNFEWDSGYTTRFGLYFVDYKNNFKRYPKKSAQWFAQFLNM